MIPLKNMFMKFLNIKLKYVRLISILMNSSAISVDMKSSNSHEAVQLLISSAEDVAMRGSKA